MFGTMPSTASGERRRLLWLLRARAMTIATVSLAVLALGGCTLPDRGSIDVDAEATEPPPTPGTTAPPWGGAPHQLPAGWTPYYGPHFTIALPPGWRVEPVSVQKEYPTIWYMSYDFYPPADPGTSPDHRAQVVERDGLRGQQVRDYFCRPTADYEVRTVAGLPMRFSQWRGATGPGSGNPDIRAWTFISNHQTVYNLVVYDKIPGYPAIPINPKGENSALVETFAPQYTTWGCA
jgi:hypothetical protein